MLNVIQTKHLLIFLTALIPAFSYSEEPLRISYRLPTHSNKVEELNPAAGFGKRKSLLSRDFIEKTLAPLPAHERAQLDWVTLSTSQGQKLTLPKVLLLKYPARLISQVDGIKIELTEKSAQKYLKEFGKEGIPLRGMVIGPISSVLFFNSNAEFAKFRSVKRSDPGLIRGEKGFIQFCMACHYPRSAFVEDREKLEPFWIDEKHPAVPGYIELDPVLKRAIKTYTTQK